MDGYKGFDENLKCRGYQFEIGETYEESKAVLCQSGFHFCKYPLAVFDYYHPSDSRYCLIEADGQIESDDDGSKVCASRLKVGLEIGLPGLIKAAVEYIKENVDWKNSKKTNTGYQSAATNTGHRSAATNTGHQSAATNTGHRSAATNTGHQSAATNTGYQSAATNTGYRSAATNTGYQSAATNTGDRSAATVEGKESIACALGFESKARGKIGCWLVLAEWELNIDYSKTLIMVKAINVDGLKVKEDVFYKLRNGEAEEVEEEQNGH